MMPNIPKLTTNKGKIVNRKRALLAAAAAALIVAGGAVAAGAGSTQAPPTTPGYVDAKTGRINEKKMPDRVTVVGPDGKIKKDANGKPITVPMPGGPPPEIPGAKAETPNAQNTGPAKTEVVEGEGKLIRP